MLDPLLKFWEEAYHFKALPTNIYTDVIKHIYKKGRKIFISNGMPITMLTFVPTKFLLKIYKGDQISTWIRKEKKVFDKGKIF